MLYYSKAHLADSMSWLGKQTSKHFLIGYFMSRSGGMSQLFKGIIIGVLLIMAIIGTMSLLDSDDSPSYSNNDNKSQSKNQDNKEINTPAITLNPIPSSSSSNQKDTETIGDLNAEIPEEVVVNTEKPAVENPVIENTATENTTNKNATDVDSIKPVLENERTTEEALAKDAKKITYGLMELSAINPTNNQSIKASYAVYDQKNKKVAQSNNASNVAYRLPTGQYKVQTTLTRIDEVTKKAVPVMTKSRYMIVRTNSTARQTFKLEPPSTTGVLQVSAKINEQIIRANYIVQKANGEVVASRNSVTSSLFKLKSGTYKVTVNSGSNTDFKSVEVKAGESLQTVFNLKQAAQQGKLLVRVFDTRSSNPVRADITITNTNGTVVQKLKSAVQTELSLVTGNYIINVVGPNGTSNKSITITPGQAVNEVFRFDVPDTDSEIASQDNSQISPEVNTQSSAQTTAENTVQNTTQENETQINDNVTIKSVETNTEAPVWAETNKGTLSIIAQDEETGKPIKSNIYIQTPSGKHLDKKTYVNSANFSLEPGVYKVTVRATNRSNSVKSIRITENQKISETFLLKNPNKPSTSEVTPSPVKPTQAASSPTKTTPAETTSPAKPTPRTPSIIQSGFLNISMLAPRNQKVNPNALNSHFIVTTTAGKKIVELTSVNIANFKLDVGSYIVTAIHKNKRRSQRINIRPNQNTRLAFNTADFEAAKGKLRSRIVDETGRPLRGDLTVTNASGQLVARANNTSNAVFDLPSSRYTIRVNYQGLSGSEVVNITANETTIQTFTIASN